MFIVLAKTILPVKFKNLSLISYITILLLCNNIFKGIPNREYKAVLY